MSVSTSLSTRWQPWRLQSTTRRRAFAFGQSADVGGRPAGSGCCARRPVVRGGGKSRLVTGDPEIRVGHAAIGLILRKHELDVALDFVEPVVLDMQLLCDAPELLRGFRVDLMVVTSMDSDSVRPQRACATG